MTQKSQKKRAAAQKKKFEVQKKIRNAIRIKNVKCNKNKMKFKKNLIIL